MSDHYDVILIGTGAGGGTLLHKLAASGKGILVLERGPFLPREKETGIPRSPSTPHAISVRKSRTTATAEKCARECAITSGAIPSFMARRSSGCASPILSRFDTSED
jgi:choline dehydrogenase-like flavoprotein